MKYDEIVRLPLKITRSQKHAITRASHRAAMTVSDYVRSAIEERLQRDGEDLDTIEQVESWGGARPVRGVTED